MKSLSAVSIRQYERAADALRHYTQTIELGLQVVLRRQPVSDRGEDRDGPLIAIVFGSDHGLCGRFNEQIAGFALGQRARLVRNNDDVRWLTVGLRAGARLEAAGQTVDEPLLLPASAAGLTATAERVLLKLDEWRAEQGATKVVVFHNRRTEDTSASPHQIQMLPLPLDWLEELRRRPWNGASLPTFTMESDALLSSLVREYLLVVLHRAGAESMASEHATRLATMQAAERNIQEHLDEMNAEYRRRRQQSITEELLDVVAGFESLRARTEKAN